MLLCSRTGRVESGDTLDANKIFRVTLESLYLAKLATGLKVPLDTNLTYSQYTNSQNTCHILIRKYTDKKVHYKQVGRVTLPLQFLSAACHLFHLSF